MVRYLIENLLGHIKNNNICTKVAAKWQLAISLKYMQIYQEIHFTQLNKLGKL